MVFDFLFRVYKALAVSLNQMAKILQDIINFHVTFTMINHSNKTRHFKIENYSDPIFKVQLRRSFNFINAVIV